MRRLFFLALAAMVFSLFTMSAMGQNERNKAEFFAGYSYLNSDIGFDEDIDEGVSSDFDDRLGMHGFEAAITGNFHRYVGAKFDFSMHTKTKTFSEFTKSEGGSYDYRLKLRTNQFLGGLQFKDNKKEGGRVRPFAHVLAGVANQKITFSDVVMEGSSIDSVSKNSFAMVFGGGVDVHVGKRVDIRLFQIDFNPIFMKADSDLDIGSHTQKNFRISAGVVFH